MRIQHTVVFRLRHEAGSVAEKVFLSDARGILADLPTVEGFEVREQVSGKSDLRWQLSMWFADQGAYDAYDAHPRHRAFVAERWADEVEQFQEYDFVSRSAS
jgi:hypothetical protein